MKDNFTKQDLKTGMIVTCRNEEEYRVFLRASIGNFKEQQDLLINNDGYNLFSEYTDDLYINKAECCYPEDFQNDEYDIMMVEQPNYPSAIFKSNDRTLLWERKEEPKEISLSLAKTFAILKEKYGDDVTINIEGMYTTFTDFPSDGKDSYLTKEELK